MSVARNDSRCPLWFNRNPSSRLPQKTIIRTASAEKPYKWAVSMKHNLEYRTLASPLITNNRNLTGLLVVSLLVHTV